jgi:hypothetical protein
VFAHGVQFENSSSAFEKKLGGFLFFAQFEGRSGGGRQCASTAGECAQDQIFLGAFFQAVQNESSGLQPCLIRHRMRRFHYADLLQWDPMTVFYGNPTLREAVSKDILKGFGHGRRSLSEPGYDDSIKEINWIGVPSHLQPILDQPHMAPDRFFRVHRFQPSRKNLSECALGLFIHNRTSISSNRMNAAGAVLLLENTCNFA